MAVEELKTLTIAPNVLSDVLKGRDPDQLELVLRYSLLRSNELPESLRPHVPDLLSVAESHDDELGGVALDVIINLSGGGMEFDDDAVRRLTRMGLSQDKYLGEPACQALCNMSRSEGRAVTMWRILEKENLLKDIVDGVINKNYNKRQRLVHLSEVLGNLAQSPDCRKWLLCPEADVIPRVLPVMLNGATTVERRGIASALFNCLFASENHSILLNRPFDILPSILLPLAGPEEFDDEDYEKMPLELQYLPSDKEREQDPELRLLYLRCLLLLCSSKGPRMIVRNSNSYYILREYHKWETDRKNLLAVENVIDILIRTEDEIGVDNLSSLEVPSDLTEKFKKMDSDYINGE